MAKRAVIIGGVCVLAVGLAATVVCLALNDAPTFPKGYSVGIWDWTAPDHETRAQQEANASALQREGVTDVYIDISSYNDHDEIADPAAREQQRAAFINALRDEVILLHSHGIRAGALAGNAHWANSDYWYVPLKLMDFVASYNKGASTDEQLTGIQFDIEFYSAPEFQDNPTQSVADYKNVVEQLCDKYRTLFSGAGAPGFGFVIPSWFDGSNTAIPKTPKPLAFWLADELHTLPQSMIAVMAYRMQPDGVDGTEAKMRPILSYVQQSDPSVHVLIGQETTDVRPAKITFYGHSMADMKQAAVRLQTTFGGNRSFTGFMVNDETGFLRLKD
ncbi:MAG TPA: hypothetical protein VFT53_01180 [Candidatus Saccharimonadales bacterium]|nr:hypothetical protein [Candidatus Saccharimonadales bacterium]